MSNSAAKEALQYLKENGDYDVKELLYNQVPVHFITLRKMYGLNMRLKFRIFDYPDKDEKNVIQIGTTKFQKITHVILAYVVSSAIGVDDMTKVQILMDDKKVIKRLLHLANRIRHLVPPPKPTVEGFEGPKRSARPPPGRYYANGGRYRYRGSPHPLNTAEGAKVLQSYRCGTKELYSMPANIKYSHSGPYRRVGPMEPSPLYPGGFRRRRKPQTPVSSSMPRLRRDGESVVVG